MLKKIITIISALLITSIAHAENQLTVLNTGSKTGGLSQQSLAYYQDLIKKYDSRFEQTNYSFYDEEGNYIGITDEELYAEDF